MKYKQVLKVISFVLGLISLSICLYLLGQLNGFEQGYISGVFNEYPHVSDSSLRFSSGGPNFFEFTSQGYLLMVVGISVYLYCNFLKPAAISIALCIFSLAIVFVALWRIIPFKNEILAMEYKFSYDYWLNNSIYSDWFCLFTAVILLLIQIALTIPTKVDIDKI
ncbi:MAG: hypothetical protein LH614_16830 [Pyrinomonadaceae bacterium]|nr:hypothetical protein [Pyrinomonadaceae bacterium]